MTQKQGPTRSSVRRKVVLPVTVIRKNGLERQLAHTLDLTEVSARLGGLTSLLEPGEIVEIQRGPTTNQFQVFWMGAPGSAMEGQAGIRYTGPQKNVWGATLPPDEADNDLSATKLRKGKPPVEISYTEKRWHTRFECNGSASVLGENSSFPVRGQVKDIAQGGVYVETSTPLPVNTQVQVKVSINDTTLESIGVVRTSYPLVGMGISFQNLSPEYQQRVAELIRDLRRKSICSKPVTDSPGGSAFFDLERGTAIRLHNYQARVLASAVREFMAHFEEWKSSQTEREVEELAEALADLNEKFNLLATVPRPSEFTNSSAGLKSI